MIDLQERLAKIYKYRKIPKEDADCYMQQYLECIPSDMFNKTIPLDVGYQISGKRMKLYSKDGTLFANGYTRIVVGHYGAFLEISPEDMIMDEVIVKRGQEYRIRDEKYSKNVKYHWYTLNDYSDCKLYFQQKGVAYADYKPNMWYISPFEVCTLKEVEIMNTHDLGDDMDEDI